jgi:hypothetical protein
MVQVKPEFRGRGLATAFYDHVERLEGRKLRPSNTLLPGGRKLWERRDPAALAAHDAARASAVDLTQHRERLVDARVEHPSYGEGHVSRVYSSSLEARYPTRRGGGYVQDEVPQHEVDRLVRELAKDASRREEIRKFNPDQPREPAGSPHGGEWVDTGAPPANAPHAVQQAYWDARRKHEDGLVNDHLAQETAAGRFAPVPAMNELTLERAIGRHINRGAPVIDGDYYSNASERAVGAVQFYTGEGSGLNAKLRSGAELSPFQAKMRDELDKLVAHGALHANLELYRSIGDLKVDATELPNFDKLVPGDVVRDRAFLSTSVRRDIHEIRGADVKLKILAPKGTPAFMPGSYGGERVSRDQEVLLGRDLPLRYVGKEGDEHVFTVDPSAVTKGRQLEVDLDLGVVKFDESKHPRVPAGHEGGGQFTDGTLDPDELEELRAREKAIEQRRLDRILAEARMIATEHGMAYGDVEITTDEYPFELDGKQYRAAGSYNPETGKIRLYANQLSEGYVPQLMRHEIQHHKWATVKKLYQAERDAIIAAANVAEDAKIAGKGGKGWTDVLRMSDDMPASKEVAAKFPLYAKLHELMPFGGSKWGALMREGLKYGGVSSYSDAYWSAWKNRGATALHMPIDTPANETMAEIAATEQVHGADHFDRMIRMRGTKSPVRNLYRAVNETYDKHGRTA